MGETEVVDARRLADAERRSGGLPDGCAWLDERTMEGLDLGLVFGAIDRTLTPTGVESRRVLDRLLGAAERLAMPGVWNDAEIASDVAALSAIRKRVTWLSAGDPFGLIDLVRGGLLLRLLLLGGCMRTIERERDRLRRVVLWLGELDALRPGVSPASNAVALLVRAGYPPDIIAAIDRRAGHTARGRLG